MRMVNCSGAINVRATADLAKSCIIQKVHHFAHFTQKKCPHQSVSKCANMHHYYSNRPYMHDYCVSSI